MTTNERDEFKIKFVTEEYKNGEHKWIDQNLWDRLKPAYREKFNNDTGSKTKEVLKKETFIGNLKITETIDILFYCGCSSVNYDFIWELFNERGLKENNN